MRATRAKPASSLAQNAFSQNQSGKLGQRYGGDFAGEGGMMPGYCLFDVGARLMPTWGWLEGFTFALTVDNVFDKRYFDYGE